MWELLLIIIMAYEGANAFGMSSIKIFINESLTERERGGGRGESAAVNLHLKI